MQRKIIIKALIFLVLSLFLALGAAWADPMKVGEKRNITNENMQNNKNFLEKERETIVIKDQLSGLESVDKQGVENFLKKHSHILQTELSSDYEVKQLVRESTGMAHFKLQQKLNSIPVYGKQLNIHVTQEGNVKLINGSVLKKQFNPQDYKPKISVQEAVYTAAGNIGIDEVPDGTGAELMWYEYKCTIFLTYVVNLITINPEPKNMVMFIDAQTGQVIDKFNNLKDSSAVVGHGIGVLGDRKELPLTLDGGKYLMIDTLTNARTNDIHNSENVYAPLNIVDDPDGDFSDLYQASAVDAHYYIGKSLTYYKDLHVRNGIDNYGSAVNPIVHYGRNYNNAFWLGGNNNKIYFGDGNGYSTRPFSGSPDVVGHELTHGVIDYTCNLEYRNQSGALNESLSDTFAVLIEEYCEGQIDWLIGEDLFISGGKAGRSLQDPALYGQPAHMNNYVYLPDDEEHDNGGVHINSGIMNKAAYLIISELGSEKAGKIYYRAMAYYLTPTSNFFEAATVLVHSAAELYGEGSQECLVVKNAFKSVGILTADLPSDYVITYNSDKDGDHEIFMVSPDGSYRKQITNNSAYDSYASLSPDGKKILFQSSPDEVVVNIYLMDVDGSGVKAITSGSADDIHPAWSPDGSQIVFSRSEGLFYNLYIVNSDGSGLRQLTNENKLNLFPAWSPDGKKIAYECETPSSSDPNQITGYEIKVTDLDNGSTISLGDEIGEPSWSPDGTKIVFTGVHNGIWTIGTMNGDGTGKSYLTSFEAYRPHYSPDGKFIVTVSFLNGNWEIAMVDENGNNYSTVVANSNPNIICNYPYWGRVSTTNGTAPAVPQGLNAVPGNGKATLSWLPNSETDIVGYNIYQSLDQTTFSKVNAQLFTNTTTTVENLVNGKTYYFKVTAVNTSSLESAQSAAVSVTPTGSNGNISGLVKLEPLIGANYSRCTITLAGTGYVTTAGEDGKFRFADVPPGNYYVLATLPGYTPGLWANVKVTAGTETSLPLIELLAGDINGDQRINLSDFGKLVEVFGLVLGSNNWVPAADFNGDGGINIADFGALASNFGKSFCYPEGFAP